MAHFGVRLTDKNAQKIGELQEIWGLHNRNQTINEVIDRTHEVERWRPVIIAFQKFTERLKSLSE